MLIDLYWVQISCLIKWKPYDRRASFYCVNQQYWEMYNTPFFLHCFVNFTYLLMHYSWRAAIIRYYSAISKQFINIPGEKIRESKSLYIVQKENGIEKYVNNAYCNHVRFCSNAKKCFSNYNII
jgi:hypothetical protein